MLPWQAFKKIKSVMAISPQKFREIVFLLLYSHDFGSEEEVADIVMSQLSVTKRTVKEAACLTQNLIEKLEEIDALIQDHSRSYDFDRIPRVERNILRLSIFELCFSKAIPAKVAIAEAIRLARKFATAEAATFINAVLDAIYKKQNLKNTIAHEPSAV